MFKNNGCYNHLTLIICRPFQWNWSTFNNINFGKTWNFFRRIMYSSYWRAQYATKKAKNVPTLLSFQGETSDKIMYYSIQRFKVQSFIMCYKAPWEGIVFCWGLQLPHGPCLPIDTLRISHNTSGMGGQYTGYLWHNTVSDQYLHWKYLTFTTIHGRKHVRN